MTCSIDGCENSVHARGWCGKHYQRWLHNGDPLLTLTPTLGISFEDKVKFHTNGTTTKSGCLEWVGPISQNGYGTFEHNGIQRSAHAATWELANGQRVPKGKMVLHTCDNKRCVLPEHLYAGTHGENMRDMVTRDRSGKGERNANAKLTASDVLAIRASSDKPSVLAVRYSVAREHINGIIRRVSWKHI